jgi:hypothetical protein
LRPSFDDLAQSARQRGARDFARLAYHLLRNRWQLEAAAAGAHAAGWQLGKRTAVETVLKAAASGATLEALTTAGAGTDFDDMQLAFVGSLATTGAFDGMLASTMPIDPRTAGVMLLTSIGDASEGATVAEAAGKPVLQVRWGSPVVPDRFKAAAVVVLSETLLGMAEAAAVRVVERELRRGVVAATDRRFLALLADGAPTVPSAGTSAANVLADLEAATDAMSMGDGARLFLVTNPRTCRHLAFKPSTAGDRAFPELTVRGGALAGITVIASDQMPGGSPDVAGLLVDASQIATWSGGVGLSRARHASVQMDDTPNMFAGGAGSPDAPAGSTVVNLWQTNCVGLRAERPWNAVRLRTDAVAVIEGAW